MASVTGIKKPRNAGSHAASECMAPVINPNAERESSHCASIFPGGQNTTRPAAHIHPPTLTPRVMARRRRAALRAVAGRRGRHSDQKPRAFMSSCAANQTHTPVTCGPCRNAHAQAAATIALPNISPLMLP